MMLFTSASAGSASFQWLIKHPYMIQECKQKKKSNTQQNRKIAKSCLITMPDRFPKCYMMMMTKDTKIKWLDRVTLDFGHGCDVHTLNKVFKFSELLRKFFNRHFIILNHAVNLELLDTIADRDPLVCAPQKTILLN